MDYLNFVVDFSAYAFFTLAGVAGMYDTYRRARRHHEFISVFKIANYKASRPAEEKDSNEETEISIPECVNVNNNN